MISTQAMKKGNNVQTMEHYKLIAYFSGQAKAKNYYGEFTKTYLNAVGGQFLKTSLEALVHKIKEIHPRCLTLIIYDNFAEVPPMPEDFEQHITEDQWIQDNKTVLKIVKQKVIMNKLPKNEKFSWLPPTGERLK